MKPKTIGKSLLLLNLMSVTALHGQDNSNKRTNDINQVLIDSNPRGAFVEIEGNYRFMGRTPFIVPYPLFGKYKIQASKEGYESVDARVNLVRRGYNRLTIRLYPRTRFKAAYRSLLLPGWGQFYGQSTLKGLFVSMSQVALGTVTFFAVKDYINEKNEYESALAELNRAQNNVEEAERAFEAARQQLREADDAFRFRNTMIFVTAGFWFYNILDAILFFSSGEKATNIFNNPRFDISSDPIQKQVTLKMKVGL